MLHDKFVLANFHNYRSCSTDAIKKAVKLLIVFCEGKELFRAVA
ncbi:hypothetical protein GGQ71_004574 [Rhizobium taibaishanense]|uniref:Uncharacterized protein n=1 Tax=Allorhizobium taibaishanense TaxID=887144 RepID=A0A7W6HSS3_9HYPH|nr:hypothetical protein [Allorhizobium taibaishanense]